jgi:uncharacterized protein involved in exopolysaccharide biosynthesis
MPSSFDVPTSSDYFETFRRRLNLSLSIFGVVFGIAAIAAIGLTDVYRSSTEMRIDLEGPNVDLLEPLALTSYADQYIDSLRQRAITDDNITAWIEETEAYAEERDDIALPELVARVHENIRIEMVATTVTDPRSGKPVDLITGFAAAFNAHKPEDARIIAQKLAAAFLDEDRQIRTERAAAASGFLRGEIDLKRQEIIRLEAEIAEFKEANAGSLPELMGLNMTVLERSERDLQGIETEIRALQQDKIFRESQLEEIRQGSVSVEGLRKLEEEYLRAISIYGPDHPDVVRMRRQVAAMTGGAIDSGEGSEIQRMEAELAAARQRYSEVHPDVLSLKRRLETLRSGGSTGSTENDINPVYLQLRAQVNALNTELAGLRARALTIKDKFDQTQDRIARMPQVEREYLKLNRALQTEQLAFDDLRSRMAQAQQTESFESGERGARLVKVRDAALPGSPAGPPRIAIMVLGSLLAVALAIGATVLAEALDGSVRSRRDVQALVNTPPIAEIPIICVADADGSSRRRIAIIGTTVVVIGVILFIVMSGA